MERAATARGPTATGCALTENHAQSCYLKRARKRPQPSGGATAPGSTAGSSGGVPDSGPGSSGTCASAITGGGRGSSCDDTGSEARAGSSPPPTSGLPDVGKETSGLPDVGVKTSGRSDSSTAALADEPSDLPAAG